MNKAAYVDHYNRHYLQMGEAGAGQLVWKPQYELWVKAGFKPYMGVLDYGCGVGVMFESPAEHYVGVDISEEAIRLAKKRFPEEDWEGRFRVFEMGKLDLIPFNMVAAQSVFTHTPKAYVPQCLDDIRRHFKDFAVIDVLLGDDDPADEHVRYYAPEEWENYLWQAGLKGEILGEIDFVGYNHVFYKVTHES